MKLLYVCCLFTAAFADTVYHDIVTGEKLFSDAYPMKLVDQFYYEVEGKMVPHETMSWKLVIDIVRDYNLTEVSFSDKGVYDTHLIEYKSAISDVLDEDSPAELAVFEKNIDNVIEGIIERAGFKNLKFYRGKSNNYRGMVLIVEFKDWGTIPIMYAFKHGLLERSV